MPEISVTPASPPGTAVPRLMPSSAEIADDVSGRCVPVDDPAYNDDEDPSGDSLPPVPATRLGRYIIAGRIATGGMATVYLARLTSVGGFAREFALKVIHPHLADQPGFRERFHREARLAARVHHPNLVTTIDVGEDAGHLYMALELIEGGTLRQLVAERQRPFPAPEAAQIITEVARGLHALHSATDEKGVALNVVHRDLAPHNVMLDRTGRAVLIDLGLAKADDNAALTQFGVLAGRLPYMSPEQARQDPLDARSDVFSLGTVLYELVTSELPFGENHDTTTMECLLRCDLRPLAETLDKAAIPDWLKHIILVCLQSDPEDRFDTAEALADALSQELTHAGFRVLETRQRLARIVEAALPELGTLAAQHALPRRIEPDPSQPIGYGNTGRHPAVKRVGLRPIAWAFTGALTGAILLFAVLFLGDFVGQATPTQQDRPTSLAPATAPRDAERGEALAPQSTTPSAPVAPPAVEGFGGHQDDLASTQDDPTGGDVMALEELATDGEEEAETGDRPTPRRRRRVARPRDSAEGLKPNPYSAH